MGRPLPLATHGGRSVRLSDVKRTFIFCLNFSEIHLTSDYFHDYYQSIELWDLYNSLKEIQLEAYRMGRRESIEFSYEYI